jgi:hypothetical protein
LRYQVW